MIKSARYMLMRIAYDAGRSYVKAEIKKRKSAAAGQHYERWRAAVAAEWPAKPGTAAHLDNLLQVPEIADLLRRLLQAQYVKDRDPIDAANFIWSKLWH